MRTTSLLLAAALIAVSAPGYAQDTTTSPVPATTATSTITVGSGSGKALTDAQRSEVEDVIKNYLVNKHPEVLMEAMKELQKRDQAGAEAKSKEAVTNFKDKIFNDPTSPVGGNPKGDVTMVEFFDFQCGYCKMSEEGTEKELKTDGNIRFIYKDFPILGPMSTTASKAALASVNQGKYIKFHDALMNKKDHLTEDMIYQIAKEIGLDVEKLKKDMNDPEIAKIIEANLKLGNDIGVRGTPMFIIGDQIYPGALQPEQLKKAVDDARAAAKK
jgi:protein-disulfide isomerase